MAGHDESETRNVALVREFHEAVLTEKDLGAVDELLSPDYVEHNPAFPDGVMRGRENLVEFWEGLFEAFPDLTITEEDVLVEGDTVVTRHTGRGTHEGRFMDLEATGNDFVVEGIDVYRIEDGGIAESWINIDMMGMMRQLGAMPEGEAPAGGRSG